MTKELKPTPRENLKPEERILLGLCLQAQFLEARPIHVLLWTGSLARFQKSRKVVSILVDKNETFEAVSDDLSRWEFDSHVASHPGATVMTMSLLKSMGAAGGATDGRRCKLSESNFEILKGFHRDLNISLMVNLLGTDQFDDGGDLIIAWVLQDGTFYAGPARDDIASDVLTDCDKLFSAEAKA